MHVEGSHHLLPSVKLAYQGQTIQQAWIYRIPSQTLIQLSHDTVSTDTSNGTTLVDGPDAVWYRTEGTETMLMYYDGANSTRMTDSLVGFKFSFVNGVAVWTERRNGVYQVMMKNMATGGGTVQLTNGTEDADGPATDGQNPSKAGSGCSPNSRPMRWPHSDSYFPRWIR